MNTFAERIPLLKSFKYKLLLSYFFVILLSFGFVALFIDKNLEKNSLDAIRSSLTSQANLIAVGIVPEAIRANDLDALERLIGSLRTSTACRITIIDAAGKVLADSERTQKEILAMENHISRSEVKEALRGAVGINTHHSSTLNIDMMYVAVPVRAGGTGVGAVRLAVTLASVDRTLEGVRVIVLTGSLFALFLALLLGSVLAGQVIRPINRMIAVSRKFAEGDFTKRVVPVPRDEVGGLAAILNTMAGDLEEKIGEVKAENQKFEAVFNSMIEGVIVLDKRGSIVSINPTIEKIFSVRREEVAGTTFLGAIRNNELADVIGKVLATGSSVSGELRLVVPVQRIFQFNAAPISGQSGVSGCVVVVHDVTEMRRLETVRSDFVANVSHELKTPLTSIKGFAETLLEGALDDVKNNRSFVTIIKEHADRLNGLVNDLLSLSYLESSSSTLEKKNVDLRQLTDKVILGFTAQLRKKGLTVKNAFEAGLEVRADEVQMEHLMINLIDNAIKFNKESGEVVISSETSPATVRVVIEDTGIGIPERDLSRIFERFYRVDKARSRDLGGTGLGLSIVKHIVELHGGEVGVESLEGAGSKFWFTLPR